MENKFEAKMYPDEIALTLCRLADMRGNESSCEDALYQLKAICENPYNSDYYRDLYRVLEEIANKDSWGNYNESIGEDK